MLKTGINWEDLPREMGCGSRMTCWRSTGGRRRSKGSHVRAFGGGEATGPSPVDRIRKGTKHSLMVDRLGLPMAIRTAGANVSDHRQILPLVLDYSRIGGEPG